MTRDHARAPRGQRTSDAVPRNRGTVTTILGALSLEGFEATMTIEGGTCGDVYVTFLERVLAPKLKEGDLVVMDNAGAHKDPRVKEVLARHGAKAIYLPPYSPELNPIELAWSKLKSILRMAKARTIDSLNTAIAIALQLITRDDAHAWFKHCGYNGQPT